MNERNALALYTFKCAIRNHDYNSLCTLCQCYSYNEMINDCCKIHITTTFYGQSVSETKIFFHLKWQVLYTNNGLLTLDNLRDTSL